MANNFMQQDEHYYSLSHGRESKTRKAAASFIICVQVNNKDKPYKLIQRQDQNEHEHMSHA